MLVSYDLDFFFKIIVKEYHESKFSTLLNKISNFEVLISNLDTSICLNLETSKLTIRNT